MNNYRPIFLLLALLLLVACGQTNKTLPAQGTIQPADTLASSTITAAVGITVIPPAAASATPTTPTKPPIPSRLPTLTPFPPYATKSVLLDYYSSGFHTVYDFVLDYTFSKLVLYSDGQLVVVGKTYKQNVLTGEESNQFLAKLDALGFYRIESNQNHDHTDLLYNFGDQYARVHDDINHCVLVEGKRPRNLCVYEHYKDFAVPEMRNVLAYLDTYPMEGMTPYSPDRLLLSVQIGRNPYDNDLPELAVDWPKNFPSLATENQKILYADGKTAAEIYHLFGNTVTGIVFTENAIEYTVYPKIVLPHEVLKNVGP